MMKSFADWTDEIRALMNPPAPMVDTCNMSALELGTKIHMELESQWPKTVGMDWAAGESWTPNVLPAVPTDWAAISKKTAELFPNGHGYDPTSASIIAGHRAGKSRMQAMATDWRAATTHHVMAPMLKMAEQWAMDNGIPPNQWRYLWEPEQLCGLKRGTKVTLLGNWWSNKRAEQVEEIQAVRAARELEIEYV